MILFGMLSQLAFANFKYSNPTVTVVSPLTDMIYDYDSNIPLIVKVEIHPSGFPSSSEELAEVRYNVDGQPENNASIKNELNPRGYGVDGYANATLLGFSKGAHKLFIHGHTDFHIGNSTSEISFNRTIYFVVEAVSPTIEVISPQQTTYNSITVSLKFKSSKSLVWAGYSLDQKMIVDCLDGANITYLQNGVHSLRVYGTDGSGNVYASNSVVFSINGKSPPIVTLDVEKMSYDRQFLPSDYKNMTYWHLVFHVNEPTSWTGCSINGGANQTIEGNETLHFAYGKYTIVVYAADLCGNKGASAPYTFILGPGEAGSAYNSPSPNQNSIDTLEHASQNALPWLPIAAVFVAVVAVIALAARAVTLNEPEQHSNPRKWKATPQLIAQLNALPKTSTKIFGDCRMDTLKSQFLKLRKKQAVKLQNPRLLQIGFHTLRHWKATMLYHKTKDPFYVRDFLGHKSMKNTEKYAKVERTMFGEYGNDEFTVKIAQTPQEISTLLEVGFEYVCQKDNLIFLRKRK